MAKNCTVPYDTTETKQLTKPQQLDNLVYIVDTLMNSGLPNITYNVAFAIAGNISAESSFNPTAEYKKSGAYGLCQWYQKRETNLINFCNENNLSYTEREGQLKFLVNELKNGYKSVYNTITNMNDNIDDMAYTFCMKFEVPGEQYCKKRPGYARECAKKYKEIKGQQ